MVLQDAPSKRRMAGKNGYLWRGTKVQIIYGYIYHPIGEGKFAKTWLIIEKRFQRVTLEEPMDYK